jgi:hypothetical protein
MNHQSRVIALLFALIAELFFAKAAIGDEPSYKVVVDVTFESTFSSELQSCINREMRKLGDVVIVGRDANFTFSLVALEVHIGNVETQVAQKRAGYVSSLTIIDHQLAQFLASRPMSAKQITAQLEQNNFVAPADIRALGIIQGQYAMADNDLESLCTRLVAKFDVHTLEPRRRAGTQ